MQSPQVDGREEGAGRVWLPRTQRRLPGHLEGEGSHQPEDNSAVLAESEAVISHTAPG